jgi:EmrB/QacA subfamily drug resistance transporter
MNARSDNLRRWLALLVLCLGELMIVLDSTIVNVALPSIRADLGFSEAGLVWVVNAYMLTYSGFLLLGGRLGDLYGQRRLFLWGLLIFTAASLACGIAGTRTELVAARLVQGLGGAIVSAVALSLIMNLFTDASQRAKAMGVFGFVCAGGGSVGVLAGGVLTSMLSWHWIFLVNLPIGVAVIVLCRALLAHAPAAAGRRHVDLGGALTITIALMLAVYAIVDGNRSGWLSTQSLALFAAALALALLFLRIESRVPAPLVPLALFRLRNIVVANIAGILWAAAMFAWFFISALYLQRVLGYDAMRVGLAYLPANLIMAVFSLGISATLVTRFGIRAPLAAGLLMAAAGLLWFARAPVQADFLFDILPPMVLMGLGAGIAFNPVLLAATSGLPSADSGLASGVVNTSFNMGGALGLASLASAASARTDSLLAGGSAPLLALDGGYQLAFRVGAGFALTAALIGVAGLRIAPVGTAPSPVLGEPPMTPSN